MVSYMRWLRCPFVLFVFWFRHPLCRRVISKIGFYTFSVYNLVCMTVDDVVSFFVQLVQLDSRLLVISLCVRFVCVRQRKSNTAR